MKKDKRVRLIDKYCLICGKQLLYGNKSGYCKEHFNTHCHVYPKRVISNCIDCGKELGKRAIYYGTTRCRSCSTKERLKIPENNSNFKHGKTLLNYYCKECHKEITYAAAEFGNGYCKSCWQLGERNSSYKNPEDRKKYFCFLCGKEISHYRPENSMCIECAIASRQNHTLIVKDCDCCACKAHRGEYKGENHPNYKNGHGRHFPYPFKFNEELKSKIRCRDNHICQNCGITEEEHVKNFHQVLHVHHIDYNVENCEENNLITVCNICNIKANYNREYWKQYYKNILFLGVKNESI